MALLWHKYGDNTHLRKTGKALVARFSVERIVGIKEDEEVDASVPGADVFFHVKWDVDVHFRKTCLMPFITDGEKYAYPYKYPYDGTHDVERDWESGDEQERVLAAIRKFIGEGSYR